jgi:electron transfer flavoprotein beta subunit
LSLPAIITTDLRLNEPRYVTLAQHHEGQEEAAGHRQARRPRRGRGTPRLKTLKVSEPPKRGAGIKVADVAALVEKLKNEAKVI